MGGRLFTDKLVCGRLEVLGVWSLDSATQATMAYPAYGVARRRQQGESGGKPRLLLAVEIDIRQKITGTIDFSNFTSIFTENINQCFSRF